MKYKKEYCYGGEKRDGADDFVTAYIAENGKRIEVEFVGNSRIGYAVDGKGYYKLKDAKNAAEV